MTAPIWWSWPSWLVEAIAGVIIQLALHVWGPGHDLWKYWLVGLLVSVVYELWFDRHGWSWRDVLQRVPGQIAGELAVLFVHLVGGP